MPQVNPLITTPEEQFVVGESDFAFFGNYACRVEGGAILFCRSGSADATVNQYQGQVRRNTMVLLLPGSIFMLTDRTEDFRAAYCSFSRDLFSEAAFRMDPSFFHALRERPISHPPQRIVEGASIWLQMAAYTYRDRGNVFRNTIIKNRLQNLLLESYDKMQRFAARQHRVPETTTRQSELFHRFVALVHEHCAQEREVSFYADKLCISTRYLSTIVRSVAHSSAKEFIDRSVMLEIKMMLAVDRPFGAGDRLPAPVSRPVLPRAFFQEARGGIAHRVPQQQKIGIRVSDFCPLRAVNSASGTVCVPA